MFYYNKAAFTKTPQIEEGVYIKSGAVITGDVHIGTGSSIWHNAVLRGDTGPIRIGRRVNIQEGCVLHLDPDGPIVDVGNDVTVGHTSILHGCTVGHATLIGMGSIILDGAVIGHDCIIGAGSLVTHNTVIPSGMLALGRPAKVVRPLTMEEMVFNVRGALDYLQLAVNTADQ